MAKGQQGEFTQQNEESTFFAALIGIPIACFAGWTLIGKYFYAYQRMAIYWLLSFGGNIPTDVPVLGWITRQYLFFRYTPAKEISYMEHALTDSLVVNTVLLILILLLVMKQFFFIDANHPFAIFGRQMNIYQFMHQQMKLYPHLRLMWKLRLLARPINVGLFRSSDSAKNFCRFNGLVSVPSVDGEAIVDETKAEKVFRSHLGRMMPLLTTDHAADAAAVLECLDNNEKAILAAVLPRLAACDEDASNKVYKEGIEVSQKLANQYWVGFDKYTPQLPDGTENVDAPLVPPPPPVDTTGCDEVLLEYMVHPIVRKSMESHAYIRTFLYDALQACRRVGKFPSSELRWLMMYERCLWFVVSSAGRREPFWECAGLHSHYLYERKLGKAHERPEVNEAVFALVDELENRMTYTLKERKAIWDSQDASTTKKAEQAKLIKEAKAAKEAKAQKKA